MTEAKCKAWELGEATKHPPSDELFLTRIVETGHDAFIGPGGLFGGESDEREFLVIHRGRRRRWELFLREHQEDVESIFTTNLDGTADVAVAWLSGEVASVVLASLRSLEE